MSSKMLSNHPTGTESAAIPHFVFKISKIPQKKLSNTAVPQAPMSLSILNVSVATVLHCHVVKADISKASNSN